MSPDPSAYFRACLLIASVGCCLIDVELLTLVGDLRHGIFAHTGYFSTHWLVRVAKRRFGPRIASLDYPLTTFAVAVRLIASVLIAASTLRPPVSLVGLGTFVAASVFIQTRGGLGNNGSDDMLLLVMFASFLGRLVNTPTAISAVLLFLSAQVSLAYLVSGAVKASQLSWRDGSALTAVMSTETFGHRGPLAVLSVSARLAAVLATLFVFGELSGSLAPWLPPTYAFDLLLCALAFHTATAVIMGLNTFLPAFAATYPAALYTSHLIYRHAR
jgi:hypothetical protein